MRHTQNEVDDSLHDRHRNFVDATFVQNSAVAPKRKVRPLEVFTSIRFA